MNYFPSPFKLIRFTLVTFFCLLFVTSAYSVEVAVTFDGIPAHGDLPAGVTRLDVVNSVISTLKKHHISAVYGMVVGNLVTEQNQGSEVLQQWLQSGNKLGNHSFSHWDLSEVDAKKYIDDIHKTDLMLARTVKESGYKYFRYPYSSEGDTPEKYNTVKKYLLSQHYKFAPVTIDFSDYSWNEKYVRCVNKGNKASIAWLKKTYIESALDSLAITQLLSHELFKHDIKNVLLIHFGVFEALMLDDLLTAYAKHGVKFISLPNALTDPIYTINPIVVRKDGIASFLEKIRLAKGLKESAAVTQLINKMTFHD